MYLSWSHPSILQSVSRWSRLWNLVYPPHHPGVLQTEVLVNDVVDELGSAVVVVVVVVEPWLSKYFQFKQSTHSTSGSHTGTVS